MIDPTKAAVLDRLAAVQVAAVQLAALLQRDDAPGMLTCRIGVDADVAARTLGDHAAILEALG